MQKGHNRVDQWKRMVIVSCPVAHLEVRAPTIPCVLPSRPLVPATLPHVSRSFKYCKSLTIQVPQIDKQAIGAIRSWAAASMPEQWPTSPPWTQAYIALSPAIGELHFLSYCLHLIQNCIPALQVELLMTKRSVSNSSLETPLSLAHTRHQRLLGTQALHNEDNQTMLSFYRERFSRQLYVSVSIWRGSAENMLISPLLVNFCTWWIIVALLEQDYILIWLLHSYFMLISTGQALFLKWTSFWRWWRISLRCDTMPANQTTCNSNMYLLSGVYAFRCGVSGTFDGLLHAKVPVETSVK